VLDLGNLRSSLALLDDE